MTNRMIDRYKTLSKVLAALGGALLFADGPWWTTMGTFLVLWAFWEELGNLTLWVYDDHCSRKAAKALLSSRSADVSAFYAHQAVMKVKAGQEHPTWRHRLWAWIGREIREARARLGDWASWDPRNAMEYQARIRRQHRGKWGEA